MLNAGMPWTEKTTKSFLKNSQLSAAPLSVDALNSLPFCSGLVAIESQNAQFDFYSGQVIFGALDLPIESSFAGGAL